MSVLVYASSSDGKFKKSAFEVVSYGKKVAEELGTKLITLTINANDASVLGKHGVSKVLNVSNISQFDAKLYAEALKQASEKEGAKVVILSASTDSKYLAPFLSIGLDAAYASNVVEAPSSVSPFTVKRTGFTNKAFNYTELNSDIKIVGVSTNAFGLVENETSLTSEEYTPILSESNVNIQSVDKATDKVSIADADIVVSGGRGLKGPENWGMIEELAEVLGAATACSKPVSDLGWRPHSEHVGQTGKPVATNLYIAIGISGAIQHLAGINSSKIKVVINTDAEAPFFKAADYGIVGDAFEVVPKLIEKLKEFKANNA